MGPDSKDELEALKAELSVIRQVVNNTTAMLAYWDTQQRCRFANRAYETWFGVTPKELLGKTMRELLGPIYALNLPYIEGALRGEPQSFEREIPDPRGGAARRSQAHYVPHVVDGVVQGFTVLVTDITQRKHLEDELRAAKELVTGLLETAPDGMVVVDSSGTIRRVNGASERLFGYHRDEMIGQPVEQLIPRALSERHREHRTQFAARRQTRSMGADLPLEGLRKDGSVVPIDVALGVLDLGTQNLVTAFVRDISARRQIEAELKRKALEVEDLYDHAPCGYHSLDAEGRVLRINHTEARWLGYSVGELLGRHYAEFVAEPSQATYAAALRQVRESGGVSNVELELSCRDGSLLRVLATGVPERDGQGASGRSRMTLVDMTEIAQARADRERIIVQLQDALANVKTLTGLLPICAWCNKIRTDDGYYLQIEAFISAHTDATFTHGICPDCMTRTRAF